MKKRIIGALCLYLIVIILISIGYAIDYFVSFDGIVQKVDYDIQYKPTITINGEDYHLNATGWQFDSPKIEKGDRMIKKYKQMDLYIIKQKSKDTFNFRKPLMSKR